MITLSNLSFWLNFLFFFFAVFLAFFIPGDFLLRKHNLSFFQRFALGTILGMVMWSWQGFIFGYLGFRFLSYIYLLIFFVFWIFNNRCFFKASALKKVKISFKSIDAIIIMIIVLGIFIQLVPVWGFGLQYDKGIFLCCGNREDLILHLALTKAIIKDIPPTEPGMNGALVQNYHYWSNLVVAELSRVFNIPALYLQFQYIAFFISLFLGLTILAFANLINISKNFTRWLLFLVYFGGDAIFAFLLILGKGLNEFKKVSSLEDGSTFLINPPRAFSFVILIAGLSLFFVWIKKRKNDVGIISIFLLTSTIGFKVYSGIFVLIGLSFLIPYLFYFKRIKEILIILFGYILSAIIYLPSNAGAGGLYWVPFMLANNFIVQPSFGLNRLELARLIFLEHKNLIRILEYEFFFSLIFLVNILGTKIVAFFQGPKSFLRLGKELSIVVYAGMIGSFFLGFFFLQTSGGANTFNFIVSFWLLSSIPAALALDYWQKKLKPLLKLLFVILIIAFTIPRVVNNTYRNIREYTRLDYLFISNAELAAFSFIRKNTSSDSIFVVDPYTNDFDRGTPYISAFTDRPMYFSGENQLLNHELDITKKSKTRDYIFRNRSVNNVLSSLYENKINYVIFWKNDNFIATESAKFTKSVYANSKVKILKVDRELINKYIKSRSKDVNRFFNQISL